MAEAGYAPTLYVVGVKGAPTAYVMEYLSPEQEWESVHDYIVRKNRGLELSEFDDLHRVMEGANIVHGDLRPNNFMMRKKDDKLKLKVIDFDRSGLSREVEYPPLRNENIPWPDKARKPIIIRHDRTLLQRSFKELLSKIQ
jgi:tRNA A-37 threonylcarbamoyl transferase component Bud32